MGGGRRYEPGKLHLGVGTPLGGSRSLSHLPPPPPEESLAPEGVCSPGLDCDSLGEGAEQLACWGERVSVLIPWARSAEAHPGILCFDSRVCGGPSGPLGLQVGSGGWAPPTFKQLMGFTSQKL